MAKVKVSGYVPGTPEQAWTDVSNLADLGSWLSLHEAWRSDVPAELTVGTRLVGVARVKGMRNRVTWTVSKADRPTVLALSGDGKGGTKLGIEVRVTPDGSGSTVDVQIELGGRPLFGPIGSGVARAVKGDVENSLQAFVDRHSG
ncbi:MAG: SRPBCC family protein [Aldersonia sp.]|nr:SRPBCC family protein [Aldersonia sp.]